MELTKVDEHAESKENKEIEEKNLCGLVMPISEIDGCSEEHWKEIKQILEEIVESVQSINIYAKLVSESDSTNLIQKNIINRLYNDKVVICDVSGRNYNVMFELGIRIAFNKPVVVIFDKEGIYPFDISNIPYIEYPRNMNYHGIQKFKKKLIASLEEALKEKENSFLKTYKDFKFYNAPEDDVAVSKINSLILEQINEIRQSVNMLYKDRELKNRIPRYVPNRFLEGENSIFYNDLDENKEVQELLKLRIPENDFIKEAIHILKRNTNLCNIFSQSELIRGLQNYYHRYYKYKEFRL